MPILLRRLRAALFVAAVWALLAGAFGVVVGVGVSASRSPYPVLPDVSQWWLEWRDVVFTMAARWAAAGGALGLGFAGVLAVAERGRDVQRLSGARVAAWGAVAGVGYLLVGFARLELARRAGTRVGPTGLPYLLIAFATLFGAGCAWLTLRWARRGAGAPRRNAGPADTGRLGSTTSAEAWPPAAATSRRSAPVA